MNKIIDWFKGIFSKKGAGQAKPAKAAKPSEPYTASGSDPSRYWTAAGGDKGTHFSGVQFHEDPPKCACSKKATMFLLIGDKRAYCCDSEKCKAALAEKRKTEMAATPA